MRPLTSIYYSVLGALLVAALFWTGCADKKVGCKDPAYRSANLQLCAQQTNGVANPANCDADSKIKDCNNNGYSDCEEMTLGRNPCSGATTPTPTPAANLTCTDAAFAASNPSICQRDPTDANCSDAAYKAANPELCAPQGPAVGCSDAAYRAANTAECDGSNPGHPGIPGAQCAVAATRTTDATCVPPPVPPLGCGDAAYRAAYVDWCTWSSSRPSQCTDVNYAQVYRQICNQFPPLVCNTEAYRTANPVECAIPLSPPVECDYKAYYDQYPALCNPPLPADGRCDNEAYKAYYLRACTQMPAPADRSVCTADGPGEGHLVADDHDCDGLFDWQELKLDQCGGFPWAADSDGDGISDYDECQSSTDPMDCSKPTSTGCKAPDANGALPVEVDRDQDGVLDIYDACLPGVGTFKALEDLTNATVKEDKVCDGAIHAVSQNPDYTPASPATDGCPAPVRSATELAQADANGCKLSDKIKYGVCTDAATVCDPIMFARKVALDACTRVADSDTAGKLSCRCLNEQNIDGENKAKDDPECIEQYCNAHPNNLGDSASAATCASRFYLFLRLFPEYYDIDGNSVAISGTECPSGGNSGYFKPAVTFNVPLAYWKHTPPIVRAHGNGTDAATFFEGAYYVNDEVPSVRLCSGSSAFAFEATCTGDRPQSYGYFNAYPGESSCEEDDDGSCFINLCGPKLEGTAKPKAKLALAYTYPSTPNWPTLEQIFKNQDPGSSPYLPEDDSGIQGCPDGLKSQGWFVTNGNPSFGELVGNALTPHSGTVVVNLCVDGAFVQTEYKENDAGNAQVAATGDALPSSCGGLLGCGVVVTEEGSYRLTSNAMMMLIMNVLIFAALFIVRRRAQDEKTE